MTLTTLGTVWETFERSAREIVDDKDDGIEAGANYRAWMKEGSMKGPFQDDIEFAGPAYAYEVAEGAAIPEGTINRGVVIRYLARKIGLKMCATEEVLEDNREADALKLPRRIKTAMWRTVELDATNLMIRAEDTNYPWDADGQVLASASHTLPAGGTGRNLASVNYAPSPAAVAIYRAAVRKQVGHHGAIAPLMLKKVLFPVDQEEAWFQLTRADKEPELGNFARLNYAKSLGLTPVPLPYWSTTTTEYCFLTDADMQPEFRWVRRPKSNEWAEKGNEVFNQSQTARYAINFSDWRAFYFVSA